MAVLQRPNCPKCNEPMLLGDIGYVCPRGCDGRPVFAGRKEKPEIVHDRGWLGRFADAVRGLK